MKVLHLFECYLPDTMNWAFEMMRHLPGTANAVAAPWLLQNRYLNETFTFVRPVWQFRPARPDSDSGYGHLAAIGLEKVLPLYHRRLHRFCRDWQPDILHAHFGPVGCAYLELAKRLGIPMAVSFYGYDYGLALHRKPSLKEDYKRLFSDAAAVVSTGPVTAKLLLSLGCDYRKIQPVPPGFVPENFPFCPRNKPAKSLKLVQVATITRKKGHLQTLQAISLLAKTLPGIHLTIVGDIQDHALAREMHNIIQQNKLQPFVTWRSAVPHNRLADFLGEFDVLIQPSHTTAHGDNEGSPVVFLEAQSTGMPVISTLHADIPHIVEHGRSGILVAENDQNGLAAAIERFYLMEHVEFQAFSYAASTLVRATFTAEKSAARLKSVYQNILNP